MMDLRQAAPLGGVGDGPRRAAAEWQALELGLVLAAFDPVIVSSLATGLDGAGSDLDIVCDLRAAGFLDTARAAYGSRSGFTTWTVRERTMVRFEGEQLLVEISGEPRPVEQQAAYRHAVAHRRLVALGGSELVARVRALRDQDGLKTEPALARAVGVPGDPYAALEALASAQTSALRSLFAMAD